MNYGSFSVKTEIQEAFISGVGSAVTVIILYLTFREATSISIELCLLAPPAMCCCPFQPLLMPVIFLLPFSLPTVHSSGHFSSFLGGKSSSLSACNYE